MEQITVEWGYEDGTNNGEWGYLHGTNNGEWGYLYGRNNGGMRVFRWHK